MNTGPVVLGLTAAVCIACAQPAAPTPPPPPADHSQGEQIADNGDPDVIRNGTLKDGVRRIISYISNADDELANGNPTPERVDALNDYKRHAYQDACGLYEDVDPDTVDADLKSWGDIHCPAGSPI